MNLLLPSTIAEAAPAAGQGGASPFSPIVLMAILFGIMYFLMIRPQRRREKERKEMIATVKTGTRVMLTIGMVAQITNVRENTLVVQIAENTRVEVVRGAIARVLEDGEMPEEIETSR